MLAQNPVLLNNDNGITKLQRFGKSVHGRNFKGFDQYEKDYYSCPLGYRTWQRVSAQDK